MVVVVVMVIGIQDWFPVVMMAIRSSIIIRRVFDLCEGGS